MDAEALAPGTPPKGPEQRYRPPALPDNPQIYQALEHSFGTPKFLFEKELAFEDLSGDLKLLRIPSYAIEILRGMAEDSDVEFNEGGGVFGGMKTSLTNAITGRKLFTLLVKHNDGYGLASSNWPSFTQQNPLPRILKARVWVSVGNSDCLGMVIQPMP